ncbi:hypothetical protein AAF712_014971 [Marasmius tenuissimus]|uniref:Uncharacterized protein n=1 Tax=Marasmius tenuissimus TaxID=585030 RepID=A0ABR2Z9J9_9AGAR
MSSASVKVWSIIISSHRGHPTRENASSLRIYIQSSHHRPDDLLLNVAERFLHDERCPVEKGELMHIYKPQDLSEVDELHLEEVLKAKELEEFATRVLPWCHINDVLEIDEDRRETMGPLILIVQPSRYV